MIVTTDFILNFSKIFIWLIPLIALITFFKTPLFKGFAGELIVNTLSGLLLNKKEYRLIKNVTLPTEDGTTQIDHIIVSIYGVFVVETKNMKGWIFGGANQKNWIRKRYRRTDNFQNPLHQNYKHVQSMKQLLGLKDDQVHSLVVFIGESGFKTRMPENVTHGIGYIRYIKSKKYPVLDHEKVKKICSKIESGRLVQSFRTHRAHVKHVEKVVNAKQNSPKCPKCGSKMVLREAKKGPNQGRKFWGCSKFPECRGIVKAA